MQISIGRLRGGFCVYWTDGDGKRRRHQLKARTRKAAEAEAIDVYRRHNLARDGITAGEAMMAYRQHLGDRPTGKSMGYIIPTLDAHFGALRPDQITREHCIAYAERRATEGRRQGTVHTELGWLRSALRFAEKAGMIQKSPHVWRPEKPAPRERFLSREEISQLIESAAAPHIRLAIVLLLGTAGRVGAILDLTWDRVDFDRQVINLRLPDSATRKGRATVPMNGMTRAALSAAHEAALSDYVVEHAGRQVGSIRKGYTTACKRAGIEGATIHTLRHTAAVYMAEAGVPMWKISQYLGHSNTAVTERVYARFAPSAMQDAADVLNFTEARSVKGKVQ